MSYHGTVGAVTQTGRESGVYSLEWEIPGFLTMAAEVGDWYTSHLFYACDGGWWLKIFPTGMGPYSGGCCDLLLRRCDDGAKTYSITAGIRGMKGVQRREKMVKEFRPDYNECFWIGFCKRNDLREEETLNGGALIVTFEVTTDEPKDASPQNLESARGVPTEDTQPSGKKNVSTQTPVPARDAAGEEIQPSEKKGIEKVVEDIGKMLASGEKSDIIVQVADFDFKVHSFVLFARCPALSISLQHESKEKVTNRIVIEDCQPEVFRSFLQYLYTGSVLSLDEQNVFHLYHVADRYLVEDLKLQCLEHIRETLSVQTFCDAVRLVLAHEQRDLLEQALEFATTNIRSIIRTVEWQVFNCDHPTEATELLIKALGPEN